MKKMLLTTLVASAAYLKYQSVRQKRSVQSILVEQGLRHFLHETDPRKASDFEKFNHVNSENYRIPEQVQKQLDFKWLDIDMQILKRDSIVTPEKKIIFYLHGGSYWYQPFGLQYHFIAKLADRVGASVIMPIYPKAPVYDVNDALSMVMKSYQDLLATSGVTAENIILLGDSAGGGLAVSLIEQLRNAQIDLPKQVILLSPWLDLSLENPEIEKLVTKDPILKLEELRFEGKYYAGSENLKSPIVSPIYGDLVDLPPITMFGGTNDILYPDMKLFTKKAKQDVRLITYEGMFHVFPFFRLPESKRAYEQIVDIIGLD
ncbi:alpha/beta hydrolase fold domain-containing protein [Liquorilactobacillus hordei]|uniref:alpha/beta hydrolase fold domain-containing protein n=1 Tax=Liquorilactobacillus hordei TaxID=468911 RepID=UPI001CBDF7B6|nr:alpha/beta hydrolase [Liquorilactobacillus hordei]MBZ2404574.1 hypothetical protein [Liquorilactobacillus hordei]